MSSRPAISPELSARAAWAAAALSIPLAFSSFPGLVGWWPLGLVGFTPLIVAIRGQSPLRALILGWTAGLVMVLLGLYWLVSTLRLFTRLSLPACVGVVLLVAVVQASRFGLFAWLTARGQRRGWPFAPVALLAWAASELVGPALFPWNYAGVVHDTPPLMQTAEIGGPIAVSLVLIAANVAVAEAVARRWRSASLLASAVAIAWLWGGWRMGVVDARIATAPVATIGVVQANIGVESKRMNPQQGVAEHLRLTRDLVRTHAPDLVVWSETNLAVPIAESDLGPEAFRQVGARTQAPVIVGAVVARGDHHFNSALLLDRAGVATGRYDKQHLVPFAERPIVDRPLVTRLFPNTGHFRPGPETGPIRFGAFGIATSICYEDVLPAVVRSGVNAGATDLLVNVSNDAWFGDTPENQMHFALAKFRAVEHRRFFVRSGNTGVSAFVDPAGRVLGQTRPWTQDTLVGQVRWCRARTWFEVLGNAPWWLATIASILAAFVRRRPNR